MMIMERVKTSVLILKLNLCSSILAELNDPVTTTFSDSESGIVYSGGVWYGLWFVFGPECSVSVQNHLLDI